MTVVLTRHSVTLYRDDSALWVKPLTGDTISTAVPVKENAAKETFTFENLSGKNVFVSAS